MIPAVFLDRDDTLVKCRGLAPSPPPAARGDLIDSDKVELLPGVAEACGKLVNAGFRLIVVTNQGAIARGAADMHAVEEIHAAIRAQLFAESRAKRDLITAFYYCPFHPQGVVAEFTGEHPWRKPGPGMILAAARELRIDLSRSWLVGDGARDVEAGMAAGIAKERCLLMGDGTDATADCADLLSASRIILGERGQVEEACVLRLRALSGEPLSDAGVRETVIAAAHATAERAGILLLRAEATASEITVTLGTNKLIGLGFLAELRRATNSWYEKKYRDGPLWGTAR